jgi:hypothetical protein
VSVIPRRIAQLCTSFDDLSFRAIAECGKMSESVLRQHEPWLMQIDTDKRYAVADPTRLYVPVPRRSAALTVLE